MAPVDRVGMMAVLGVWAACWLPGAFAGRTLPVRDLAATQLPWRHQWCEVVRAGHPPLWDAASGGGRLLWANPNAMAAYPGTLVFLLASPERAVVWHLAGHHLLFLAGCYLLARRAGASAGGALCGAAAAGFAGLAWSASTFLNFQASLAWLPWALAAVTPPPPGARRAARQALLSGTCLGLAFLGGEPVAVALGTVAVGLVVVAGWPRRLWWPAAALPAVALAVAAPIAVPLAEAFSETARGHLPPTPGRLAADAVGSRRLVELLLPGVLGAPLADQSSGFWAAPSFPWQRYYPSIFVGSLPLLLVAWTWRRRRQLWCWLAMAGLGVGGAIALGVPVLGQAAETVPGSGFVRYAIKLLTLSVLGLPVLAASGWDHFVTGWSPRRRRRLAAAAAGLASLAIVPESALRAVLSRLYPASASTLQARPAGSIHRAWRQDLGALALPLAAVAASGPTAAVGATATALAGAFSGRRVMPWDDGDRWAEPPPAARLAGAATRVVSLHRAGVPSTSPSSPLLHGAWAARAALWPEYGVRWGLRYSLASGPDGLEPWRAELMARLRPTLPVAAQARLGQALGAEMVVTPEPIPGWTGREVDGVMVATAPRPAPPVYLARRLLPAAGPEAVLLTLGGESFRPGVDAVVEGTGGASELAGGEVHEEPGAPHHRRFRVVVAGSGLLVVGQSYMPQWHSSIDGQPARTRPVNGMQLGIPLPAGSHDVEVRLDLAPYRLGLLGPLLAVGLAVVLLWPGRSDDAAGDQPGGSCPGPSMTGPSGCQ